MTEEKEEKRRSFSDIDMKGEFSPDELESLLSDIKSKRRKVSETLI